MEEVKFKLKLTLQQKLVEIGDIVVLMPSQSNKEYWTVTAFEPLAERFLAKVIGRSNRNSTKDVLIFYLEDTEKHLEEGVIKLFKKNTYEWNEIQTESLQM